MSFAFGISEDLSGFEEDIYEAISMKTCVEKRMTLGAPGPAVMEQVIARKRSI